jgi:hypothetical protein
MVLLFLTLLFVSDIAFFGHLSHLPATTSKDHPANHLPLTAATIVKQVCVFFDPVSSAL